MNFNQHKTIKYFALTIKEYSKFISFVGLIFFLLAALFGIFWIVDANNNKLEPVTFVLGACSTIFFGLPQLAEFILPTRKPIRHMTYNELIQFIQDTNAQNDWHSVDREFRSEEHTS